MKAMATAVKAVSTGPAPGPIGAQGRKPSTKQSGPGAALKKKLTLQQLGVLVRRLLVFAAAIVYIHTSIAACADSLRLLRNAELPSASFLVYESKLIARYAGTTTIRDSPLVAALQHDTTPRRHGSIFLEDTSTHFTGCASVNESTIYQDTFQREMFAAIRDSLAYNLTFLAPGTSELIMPIIDCTFTSLTTGDITAPRFFYLVRMVADPDDVRLFAVTMGIQEYQVARQKASGPSAVATMALIHDMRARDVTHSFALALGYPFVSPSFQAYEYYGVTRTGFWLLKSVPADPTIESSKIVSTSCPTGYYLASPNEQANIVYLIWTLFRDPATVLGRWEWTGETTVQDSWAWVHFLHLYYAISAIIGLAGLVTVVYYNVRAGKIWIGDAFVAISSPHWLRSALVLASWQMGEFWTLREFALFNGNELATTRSTVLYPSVMRADLLSLYLTLASMLGEVLKHRVDPALAVATFMLGFEARLEITKLFPSLQATLIAYADLEFLLGITPLDPSLPELSPLRVWNSKPLPPASAAIAFATLFPIFCTLVFVVAYVAARKLYRRVYPDLAAQQRSSASSTKDGDGRRSNLTQFEFATGVALRDRFGVVSDYDNYVYIKGMKFASADGIYTSGFVIASGKFLVAIDDLLTIALIKLTRVRFRNVFIYEVDGNNVKQTARLVYPSTMSFRDILQLNLRVLM